jgi:serine/threonine protein kinase
MASSSSSDRDPLEQLAAEFLDRRRGGEPVSPSEYAEQYPQWAEQIIEFFPALEVMEGLKPGSGDPTDSFAGQTETAGTPRLEQLGEYRILREIGHGGMGVVYEAIQESLGRRVALKILPMHGRIDAIQMHRFQLEARSAARLHHASIVPVYGVGEAGGIHYYAMQYIPGHGLDVILSDLRRLRTGAAGSAKSDTGSIAVARSLLTGRFAASKPERDGVAPSATVPEDNGSSSPAADARSATAASISSVLSNPTESGYYRAVARLGIQVAGALAYAHAQGVLHRDIKPSNLLLDVDGHVWVTDFGLAKVEGAEGPTRTDDIIGTLRFMGPERFEGWSDRRSDIYSLGVTLYEMLTLRPAFDAGTRVKLIEQVIHDPPLAPRKVDPRIPRDLETIVLKSIAKEPASGTRRQRPWRRTSKTTWRTSPSWRGGVVRWSGPGAGAGGTRRRQACWPRAASRAWRWSAWSSGSSTTPGWKPPIMTCGSLAKPRPRSVTSITWSWPSVNGPTAMSAGPSNCSTTAFPTRGARTSAGGSGII